MGAEAKRLNVIPEEVLIIMEMVLLVSLCIITVAFIDRQHASMRRMTRVRAERHERRDR